MTKGGWVGERAIGVRHPLKALGDTMRAGLSTAQWATFWGFSWSVDDGAGKLKRKDAKQRNIGPRLNSRVDDSYCALKVRELTLIHPKESFVFWREAFYHFPLSVSIYSLHRLDLNKHFFYL